MYNKSIVIITILLIFHLIAWAKIPETVMAIEKKLDKIIELLNEGLDE